MESLQPQIPEILVDIEVLGKRAGSAMIEIGAVAFHRSGERVGESFHRLIDPSPLATADLDTLDWHQRQKTWPRAKSGKEVPLRSALVDFARWARGLGVETFWAWGASFDFPHLDAAFDSIGVEPPWRYSRCQCARTVWNLAFPGVKASLKPHRADKDAEISVADLCVALNCFHPICELAASEVPRIDKCSGY